MNLHGVARQAISTVNPDIPAIYLRSTGYTGIPSGKRVPSYTRTDGVPIQVQALTARELRHLESLNIQGVLRAVYMYGNTQGVVRPDARGGDLLLFPQFPGDVTQTWLVVTVLESWGVTGGGWCKVAVCLQDDAILAGAAISSAAGTGNLTP